MLIQWNENNQNDTYGYVIYTFDANGILYELDTVWGISNINYSYQSILMMGRIRIRLQHLIPVLQIPSSYVSNISQSKY